MDSTFQSLANMYNTDVEYYQNMSDAEKNILMEQMVPAWGSAMQQMATLIGQEGLMGIMQEVFDEMDEASADFDNQLAAIADRAGGYFDFIKSGEDLIVEGMERMMDTNDAVLNQWEEMVETMKQLAASALTLADGLTQISQDAVDALKNLRDLDDYQAEQEIEDAANNAEDKVNDAMGNNDDNANNNGLDYNRDDWGDGEFPQIGDKVTYLGDPYYYDSYGTNPSGTRGAGQVRPHPRHTYDHRSPTGYVSRKVPSRRARRRRDRPRPRRRPDSSAEARTATHWRSRGRSPDSS